MSSSVDDNVPTSVPLEFSATELADKLKELGASLISLTVKEKSSEAVNPPESVEVMVIA